MVDFGLVKDLDETAWRTQDGRVFGTPLYLSPEAICRPGRGTGERPLFAGRVGYFLLTGQRVFEGQSVIEVCTQHLMAEPIPPQTAWAGRPESLSAILMACLEKSPDAVAVCPRPDLAARRLRRRRAVDD